jgi:hypothetical protein
MCRYFLSPMLISTPPISSPFHRSNITQRGKRYLAHIYMCISSFLLRAHAHKIIHITPFDIFCARVHKYYYCETVNWHHWNASKSHIANCRAMLSTFFCKSTLTPSQSFEISFFFFCLFNIDFKSNKNIAGTLGTYFYASLCIER